jgi:hypothetical protein
MQYTTCAQHDRDTHGAQDAILQDAIRRSMMDN